MTKPKYKYDWPTRILAAVGYLGFLWNGETYFALGAVVMTILIVANERGGNFNPR